MNSPISKIRYFVGLGGLLAGMSACASSPAADGDIAVAKASIERAEQSGAPQAAPVQLAAARDELLRAQKANVDRDYKPATALAQRANIDAQVAEATAQKARAAKAAAEFDASMQALRQASQPSTQNGQ
jgi:hypothetical protein